MTSTRQEASGTSMRQEASVEREKRGPGQEANRTSMRQEASGTRKYEAGGLMDSNFFFIDGPTGLDPVQGDI